MFRFLVALFLVFLVLPLLGLFANALVLGGFSSLLEVITDPQLIQSLINSFLLAIISASIAVIFSFLVCYFLHFTKKWHFVEVIIINLMTITQLIPSISFGFIVMYLFGKVGIITTLLGRQLLDIYSFEAVVFAYVLYIIGPIFVIINMAFNNISNTEFNISNVFGDSSIRKFINCVYYKIRIGLLSAFFVGFTLVFTDYGIALALGYDTASSLLYQTFLGASPDIVKGSVLALIICVPSILTYYALFKTNIRQQSNNYDVVKIITSKNNIRDSLLWIVILIVVLVSLSVLFVLGFMPFLTNYPKDYTLGLDNLVRVFTKYNILNTIIVSLKIALMTTILGLITTFMGAYFVVFKPGKLASLFDKLAVIPNLVPGMTIGIAYMLFFKSTFIYNTIFIIIIANVMHFYTSPYLIFKQAFLQIPKEYVWVSGVFGDSWFERFKNVVLKQVRIECVNVTSYLLISSLTTISAIAFLATTNNLTLALKIKELEHYADFGAIFVITLIILIINLLIRTISNRLVRNIK